MPYRYPYITHSSKTSPPSNLTIKQASLNILEADLGFR
ncbi:hypothetical protein CWATWH0402_1414 [Crocosphaera watsonii WH 0402]|uniref:Uncharacterized protein n=2 Tax=Crocosphaera watsonii TaxID=263511 RepID=T2K0W8_CROWT|nr:hypothetical protein CWATWH0005_5686 [Crocosphaera watsonii WH 0005]CCQ70907.1 hypothetical protein CWATWH0402_1414 [Crocosphaera watsonii WH 0402]